MKILHICPRFWPAYGGAELYITTIAKWSLDNGKNEVDVWTTDADEVDAIWFPKRKKFTKLKEMYEGVRVTRFKTTPFFMNNLFINKTVRYLLVHNPIPFLRILGTPPTCFDMWMQIFNKDLPKYDVIHVDSMPYYSLLYIARAIAKKTGAKLYFTPFTHLGTDKKDPLRAKYFDPVGIQFYKDSDKIFIQTDAEKNAIINFVKEKGGSIEESKFEKVGLGIFPEKILGGNPDRFRQKYGLNTDPIVFSIGAKVEVKGSFTLVRAMEKLWKTGIKARLVLMGNTSMEFESFWKNQSEIVKENTINMNSPTDEEKLDVVAAGDIFCMVSKSESFGIVYLESWMYKKPVIGCNIEAVKEVISDGVDGYLVNFNDVESLSSKIKYLIENKDVGIKMGEKGYNKVMNNYTWENKFKILSKYFINHERP